MVKDSKLDKTLKDGTTELKEATPDPRLVKFFLQAKFGEITEPTTILDRHGRIITWALPEVLHPNRLVRPIKQTCIFICY